MTVTTAATRSIRIMLVDDHPIVLKGLSLILDAEPDIEIAAQALTGSIAISLYRERIPDVVLMDLKLTESSGIDVVGAIRGEFPGARIIMLSSFDRDDDIYRSIRAGAYGYLLKDAPFTELVDAIRRVNEGRRYFPPSISEKLAQRLSIPDLTEREVDVLQLMAAGRSNKEIAEKLSLAMGTVKCHVNNIFGKLGAEDRTKAVIMAIRIGLTDLTED